MATENIMLINGFGWRSTGGGFNALFKQVGEAYILITDKDDECPAQDYDEELLASLYDDRTGNQLMQISCNRKQLDSAIARLTEFSQGYNI